MSPLRPIPYADYTAPEGQAGCVDPTSPIGRPVYDTGHPPPSYDGGDFMFTPQQPHPPRPASNFGTLTSFMATDQHHSQLHASGSQYYGLPGPVSEAVPPLDATAFAECLGEWGLNVQDLNRAMKEFDRKIEAYNAADAGQSAAETPSVFQPLTNTLDESAQIGLDETVFDAFDNDPWMQTSGERPVDPLFTTDPKRTQNPTLSRAPAEFPDSQSKVSLVNSPRASNRYVDGHPEPLDIDLPPDRHRGKLVFLKVDEGPCEWISGNGKKCDRNAPVFELLNGHGGWCCFCLSKHMPQWRRAHALLPSFEIEPMTLIQAIKEIYPDLKPLASSSLHEDASLATERDQQLKWQTRFVKAVILPYEGNNQKLRDQQEYFNGNVECDPDAFYTDKNVNARMVILFHAAYRTHVGGKVLYANNGDSTGYPKESEPLTFVRRLETIEELLKVNKRIVMDVIQGRGVLAFVSTPIAYDRRKATNNMNNELKRKDRPEEVERGSEDAVDAGNPALCSSPPKKRRSSTEDTSLPKNSAKGKGKVNSAPSAPPTASQAFGIF